MESTSVGDLVKLAGRGGELDAIVFDVPSHSKVVVAVVDAQRGPVFRAVHPRMLTSRADEGPHDRALRLLIGRTQRRNGGVAGDGTRGGRPRAGYTRTATHRTTGK